MFLNKFLELINDRRNNRRSFTNLFASFTILVCTFVDVPEQ